MKRHQIKSKTQIIKNDSIEGETIEMKIERIVNNNEPIGDGAPLVYTERKDGVMAEYDPRTDRFDVAIEAQDKIAKSIDAKRAEKMKPAEKLDDTVKPVNTSDNLN